ncbi:hypothetical protein F4777DRAFT_423642 [Nemania sp. FL0916]|nr:hypothetical protein F4777DRAFT_423642 [Nemania sp. FL0916]
MTSISNPRLRMEFIAKQFLTSLERAYREDNENLIIENLAPGCKRCILPQYKGAARLFSNSDSLTNFRLTRGIINIASTVIYDMIVDQEKRKVSARTTQIMTCKDLEAKRQETCWILEFESGSMMIEKIIKFVGETDAHERNLPIWIMLLDVPTSFGS